MPIARCQTCGRTSDAAIGGVVSCPCGAHFVADFGNSQPNMSSSPASHRIPNSPFASKPAKTKEESRSGKIADGILSGIGQLAKAVAALVILFLIVAVVINWKEVNKSGSSSSNGSSSGVEKPKHSLSLQAMEAWRFLAYYHLNEVKADEGCKGKWWLLTGKVLLIDKDILWKGDRQASVSFDETKSGQQKLVNCMFSNAAEIEKVKNLSVGQGISIAGICQGLEIGSVFFENCIIVETSEVSGKVTVDIPQ